MLLSVEFNLQCEYVTILPLNQSMEPPYHILLQHPIAVEYPATISCRFVVSSCFLSPQFLVVSDDQEAIG